MMKVNHNWAIIKWLLAYLRYPILMVFSLVVHLENNNKILFLKENHIDLPHPSSWFILIWWYYQIYLLMESNIHLLFWWFIKAYLGVFNKYKSYVFSHSKLYKTLFENQSSHCIKKLHTNNGKNISVMISLTLLLPIGLFISILFPTHHGKMV